jgi:Kdo2-lipid IVA lauroyltransferase/acyltransferase
MFGYVLFLGLVRLMQITPFWLLHRFSDGLYLLMRYGVKYRYKVVYQNIKGSFPEKSEAEIQKIVNGFYQHLCDMALESLKGFTCSKETLSLRARLQNPEVADQYYGQGRNCIALAGHCGNYEWVASVCGLQLKYLPLILYKPLTNKYIDAFVRNSRNQYGTLFGSIYDTEKLFNTQFERPVVYGLASDQSPSNMEKSYWVKFLGRDTACLHGGEHYARTMNLRAVYYKIKRVKRGYYEVWLQEIEFDPQNTYDGEFTQKFMQLVEATILEDPSSWLWSHKRWKHTKPEPLKVD